MALHEDRLDNLVGKIGAAMQAFVDQGKIAGRAENYSRA